MRYGALWKGAKMEKETIIKALECCLTTSEGDCSECGYRGKTRSCFLTCTNYLISDALALIKELAEANATQIVTAIELDKQVERLTEENERLSTALANYDRQTEVRIAEEYYTAEAYDELREENERLKAEVSVKKKLLKRCSDLVEAIQANTVREFAERLKYTLCINNEENTEFFDYSYTLETIDEVANKILNENTEEEKK